MNMYDRTSKCLEMLYQNILDIQDNIDIKGIRKENPTAYLKEFCTVKLYSPRRTGNTQAIFNFVVNHNNKDWIILFPSTRMSEYFSARLPHILNMTHCKKINIQNRTTFEHDNGNRVIIGSARDTLPLRGIEADGIIIDNSFFMNQNQIDAVYFAGESIMFNKEKPVFLFVQ